MVEVALDELPVALAVMIAKLQVAYRLPEKDRYVVVHVLPSGRRREIEYDVARGRCLTDDERRGELPAPQRTVLADLAFVTSYAIDTETSEARVIFATDDGSVRLERAVHVPLVWDGAEQIRAAIDAQSFPARYATLSRADKIVHWARVIHRYRRAHGESGRDEDEIYTPELVGDLERVEPELRGMLAEILPLVGGLEQTPADEAIAAFASRTGITLREPDARRRPGAAVSASGDRGARVLHRHHRVREWIEIAGQPFVMGLLPEEIDTLTLASTTAARDRLGHPDTDLRDRSDVETKRGNVDYLRPLIARAFAARETEIAPFAIARTPVCNGDWKRFLAVTNLPPPHGWSLPGGDADERAVIGVSWDEASRYAAWAGAALPTEAQWERAARGAERRLFPWGDAWGAPGAWLDAQPYYDPWPRGTHAELASPDGMHDAITRRWEWCADSFTGADVAALAELYPALRADGRVRRGGQGAALVACTVARTGTRPSWRADGTGFRLVRG